MRKICACFLSLFLAVSLTSCAGDSTQKSSTDAGSKSQTVSDAADDSSTTTSGATEDSSTDASSLSTEDVELTIAGPWSECTAIERVAAAFTKKYPNCRVNYEYLQNFEDTLPIRLGEAEDKVDLCLVNNIQSGSPLMPYLMELSTIEDQLDLSETFDGLLKNFRQQSDDDAIRQNFYAIPLGAEIRGMFVNKTLLKSLQLEVPETRDELLADCEVLKEHGYIPIQSNPGFFAHQLLYPYICNLVANADDYESVYASVNARDDQAMEALFADPMEFLYQLVDERYYDYKTSETELSMFLDCSNEGYARSFLNLQEAADDYEKIDDIGQVAFMPAVMSLEQVIAQTKEDYHSKIEYEFILSPVSDEGGFAYLSPGRGIGINQETDHLDWSIQFLNFLFEQEQMLLFAEDMGYVPNTSDAMERLSKTFDVPENQICELGQVTFDYSFFDVINGSLVEISKGNNPKYMDSTDDGSIQMYPFSYYMERFGQRIRGEFDES